MKKNKIWALDYFHEVAEKVPAYKKFLKKNKIRHQLVKTLDDFNKVPCVDKKNYLRKYPFVELFPNGKIPPMIAVSSGSSGQPFFWPQGEEQEKEGGKIHERIFESISGIKKGKTLVVDCFSMGTWVAGTYTLACCRWIAKKGYDLSVITPGINKEEVVGILEKFSSNFDQVILAGYPPFLMDVVDNLKYRKFNFKKSNLRFLFAGESFSEKWRTTIHEMAGIKDHLRGSANIYGTADAAILGHETPLSIFLRRKSQVDPKLADRLFGGHLSTPSFVQYYPDYKFFQKFNDNLIFTAKSGIPLVRYNIKDNGNLLSNSDVRSLIKDLGYNAEAIKEKVFLGNSLPFIVLKNREDVSVTFYSLNVYPENIKSALEDESISKYFSGKFIASVRVVNKGRTQQFIIKCELRHGLKPNKKLEEKATKVITKYLIKLNLEYRELHKMIGKKAIPKIELLAYGDSEVSIKKIRLVG